MGRRAAPRVSGAPGQKRFVAYFRVSTDKQGASGLGLEAQREAVSRHVAGAGGVIVAQFTEIETGTGKRKRPEMAAALVACRLRRATLVIAKLDRLARNVHFVSGLMESGVDFIACDNPHATRLTIHILAAVAEHEAEQISARTVAALQAARARGVKLGNPNLKPGDYANAKRARKARTAIADAHAKDVMSYIADAQGAGCDTLGKIADALTARGIRTPAGHIEWNRAQVLRAMQRAANAAEKAAA